MISAWRARFICSVSVSISSPAFFEAFRIAVIRALLGGRGLEQRAVDLRLEVDGQEPREDLLRFGLVDEVAALGILAAFLVVGLEQVLGDRQHLLLGHALHERRLEVVVDHDDAVDLAGDEELGELVRDRLRVAVVGAVAETRPVGRRLEPAKAQRRAALATRGEPADRLPLGFELTRARPRAGRSAR